MVAHAGCANKTPATDLTHAVPSVPAAVACSLRRHHHADVSVAVATPNGLITPIIPSADTKGLASISSLMKTLAAKAQDGKLAPNEFQARGCFYSVCSFRHLSRACPHRADAAPHIASRT